MADDFIQVVADGPGKKLDTESLIVGPNTVHRERNQIAGALDVEIARVLNADPATDDYGLAVRQIPTPTLIGREWASPIGGVSDTPIIASIAAGTHIVLKGITVTIGGLMVDPVNVRIGFGTATIPATPVFTSVVGMVLSHSGIAPGSGMIKGYGDGRMWEGGDDEELRANIGAFSGDETRIHCLYYIATP